MKYFFLLFAFVMTPVSGFGYDVLSFPSASVSLGVPLEFQGEPLETLQYTLNGVPAENTGGWSVDTSNRQISRSFYNSVYTASEQTADGWAGDVGSCLAGDTSADFKNSTLTRVNFFRAMAGVPSSVVFSSTYNSKSQQAALMMSRNGTLNHSPPNTWDCYTAEGAEAAGSSNLSLGNYGWGAVASQVRDDGDNNGAVGHRRWILYPQTQTMGTGDVPATSGYYSANSLWVFDDNMWGSRPTTRDDFVAWPPPGYVPYQLIPSRWSFSYPAADFSNAVVTMSCEGILQTVTLEPLASNMGESTLVWYRSDPWPVPVSDLSCDVTVSNISGAPASSYAYEVIIIDPSVAADQEETPEISGNHSVKAGEIGSWELAAVSFASSYEVLQATHTEALPEGAENGASSVLDYTDGSYDLITADAAANGTYSFHLAQPGVERNSFELDVRYIPSTASTLLFNSRLGYSTTDQEAVVQISQDDGLNWSTLFSQEGSGGSGEATFQQHVISLAAYRDRIVRLRVVYGYKEGQYGGYYPCTSADCGFLVDDVNMTDARQLQASTVLPITTGTSFSYTPADVGSYVFAARTIGWEGYPGLEWGPVFYVDAVDSFSWNLFLPAISGSGN